MNEDVFGVTRGWGDCVVIARASYEGILYEMIRPRWQPGTRDCNYIIVTMVEHEHRHFDSLSNILGKTYNVFNRMLDL